MECGKDLAEGEELLVIKEIGKVKTNKSIAERINRCVMTEIGKSVRSFGINLLQGKRLSDCGGFNLFSIRDINLCKKTLTEFLVQQAE